MSGRFSRRAAVAAGVALLCAVSTAAAEVIVGLPLPIDGSQINNDPANGINPAENAGLSDVVGGSLAAGGELVPWTAFEQATGSSQQIFVRAFKNGAWKTEGSPATLNVDTTQVAQHPGIDFAGAGRTVPWVTWYEPNIALNGGSPHAGVKNVFASNFNASSDVWVHQGQSRAGVGANPPSLNIHTNRTAEDPALAGGTAKAGGNPTPWIAWEENDGFAGPDPLIDVKKQIFVARGIGPVTGSSCAGDKPAATNTVGNFCFEQVGADRLAATTGAPSATGDPSLSIDPARESHTPDITFTGPGDTVPWVVWYEQVDGLGPGTPGLATNEQVFAAKAVPDTSPGVDGGFHWQAVGAGTAGQTNPIDTSGAIHHFGPCSETHAAENACSLNTNPAADAEHPQVTAGTLVPGKPTVPWVVWDESIGNGIHGIFVARLVGGDHFALFNGGRPVSDPAHDAVSPDIAFFGNTPYVSWIEPSGSSAIGFVGHFLADGSFNLDPPGGIQNGSQLFAAQVALSSSCTANPFTNDGSGCPFATLNDPFVTFASAPSPQRLFGLALVPLGCAVIVGCNATFHQQGNSILILGTLGLPAPVGILVQRIVGHKLDTVGKVPLGRHSRGALRIRWNLRVNGHKLAKGRYVITLRAFDKRKKHIIARAHSVTIRIR